MSNADENEHGPLLIIDPDSFAPPPKRRIAVISAILVVGLVVAVGTISQKGDSHASESVVPSRGLDVLALHNLGNAKVFRDGFWHLQGLGQDSDCDCGWVTNLDRCLIKGDRCYEPCKELNKDSFCKEVEAGEAEVSSGSANTVAPQNIGDAKVFRDGLWHLQGMGQGLDCDCGWVTNVDGCQRKGGRCYEPCKELNKDSFCKFDAGVAEASFDSTNTVAPQSMGDAEHKHGPRFDDWASENGRKYPNDMEKRRAHAIWILNDRMITAHNYEYHQGKVTYSLGHNQFSDMSWGDFWHLILVELHLQSPDQQSADYLDAWGYSRNLQVPSEWRWDHTPCKVAVKNQGQAGTCWIFSAMTALEYAMCRFWGWSDVPQVSPQQILDCDANNYKHWEEKCKGSSTVKHCGWRATKAFDFNEDHALVAGCEKGNCHDEQAQYEYMAGQRDWEYSKGNCKKHSRGKGEVLPAGSIKKLVEVTRGDDAALKAAVSQQPVTAWVHIDPRWWQHLALAKEGTFELTGGLQYNDGKPIEGRADSEGVIEVDDNSKDKYITEKHKHGHFIVIVGYGSNEGGDYWVIQNSWGTTWAENGFLKIRAGSTFWDHMEINQLVFAELDNLKKPAHPVEDGTCCYVDPAEHSRQQLREEKHLRFEICEKKAHCSKSRYCQSEVRCTLPTWVSGCDASDTGAKSDWIPVWCDF